MFSFARLRVFKPTLFVVLPLVLLPLPLVNAAVPVAVSDTSFVSSAFNNYNASVLPSEPIADNTIPPLTDKAYGSVRKETLGGGSGNVRDVVGAATKARNLLTHSDEYVARNQRGCFEKRNLVSCIKYKASKIVWMLATNSMGYFPHEYSRELVDDKRRIRIIQLGEPSDDVVVFTDARSLQGDSELVCIGKFLKRAVETFGRNHGLLLRLSGETGARVVDVDVEGRGRKEKKKRKWLIILQLITLMKIAHLKMTLVSMLLGVLGFNVLLVGGVAWLIHYLKFKTLCKIHPHLVQSHSHVYDSDPADYSSFVGSSFPGSHYSGSSGGPHEINVGYKDWGGTSKAYHAYNYLDTISKRIQ